jgi:peptidylprolyl isomerase
MRRYRFLILPLLLLVFAVAACGGEDDRSGDSGAVPSEEATEAATEAPTEAAPEAAAPTEGKTGVKVTGKAGEKPTIEVPEGAEPPSELTIEDLEEGDGAEAKAGSTISVDYVGALYKDGTVFDNSYDRGEPISFPLGAQQVIAGWDQGFEGMKVGGRRVLVIPSDLAYGPTGQGPIGPDEALVFVVELKDVSSP